MGPFVVPDGAEDIVLDHPVEQEFRSESLVRVNVQSVVLYQRR